MITIANIRNANYRAYDEVWAIVRSLRDPGMLRHMPQLSPSWGLFKRYIQLRDAGQWDAAAFRDIYVPAFLREMQASGAQEKLAELIRLDRQGRRICLACFCHDEAMCHRSIIAGILQHAGVQVQGIQRDYTGYGRLYFSLK